MEMLFFLLYLASLAEPFPILPTPNIPRKHELPLGVSAGGRAEQNDFQVGTNREDQAGLDSIEDKHELSGLLGEMFQAKLEISREQKQMESLSSQNSDNPIQGNDGIYRIISQKQLENFKAAHSDKLIFLKFSSPICAACRMLKQKFQTLHRNPKFSNAPVVFADIVVSNNKNVVDPFRDYVTNQLNVHRIPSIHFLPTGHDSPTNVISCSDGGKCSWPSIREQMLEYIGMHYSPPLHNAPDGPPNSSTKSIVSDGLSSTEDRSEKKSKRERFRSLLSSSLKWVR